MFGRDENFSVITNEHLYQIILQSIHQLTDEQLRDISQSGATLWSNFKGDFLIDVGDTRGRRPDRKKWLCTFIAGDETATPDQILELFSTQAPAWANELDRLGQEAWQKRIDEASRLAQLQQKREDKPRGGLFGWLGKKT